MYVKCEPHQKCVDPKRTHSLLCIKFGSCSAFSFSRLCTRMCVREFWFCFFVYVQLNIYVYTHLYPDEPYSAPSLISIEGAQCSHNDVYSYMLPRTKERIVCLVLPFTHTAENAWDPSAVGNRYMSVPRREILCIYI